MIQNLFKKYICIIDIIKQSGGISFSELNKKWKRSNLSEGKKLNRKTFYNYRNAIFDIFGINIKYNNTTDEYDIDDSAGATSKAITEWLLNSFSINNLLHESKNLHDYIILEEIPTSREYLTEIINAIRERKCLKIKYQSYAQKNAVELELEPLFIKLFQRRWYLYGSKKHEKTIKVYAFDRILTLHITDRIFELPADFSAFNYMADAAGIIRGNDKPCSIKIKSYGKHTEYMRSLPLHHSQKEDVTTDEYSIFSFWLIPADDFYMEVLKFREYLEIIYPEKVRDKMLEIIQKTFNYYKR